MKLKNHKTIKLLNYPMDKITVQLNKIHHSLFYFLVFLVPLQTCWIFYEAKLGDTPWQYGKFLLYATDIVLGLMLILWAVEKVQNSKLKVQSDVVENRINNRQKVFLYATVFGLLIIALISIFFALDESLALYQFIKLLEFVLLFFYVIKNKISFIKIAWVFAFGVLIQSILGIGQFLSQYSFASKWLGMAEHNPGILGQAVVITSLARYLRAYGTTVHPNVLGGYLAVGLVLILGLIIKCQMSNVKCQMLDSVSNLVSGFKKWSPVLLFLIYSSGLVALIFTFSRSAWLGFGLGFVMLMILFWRDHKNIIRQIFVISIVIVTLSLFIFHEPVFNRLETTSPQIERSTTERISGYNSATELFKKKSFTGVGIGNFTLADYKLVSSTKNIWEYQPIHNVYLLVFVESGIVGGIIWLIFLGQILVIRLRRIRKEESTDFWKFIILTSYFVILFLMFFDHYLWTLQSGRLLFWVILGLVLNSAWKVQSASSS